MTSAKLCSHARDSNQGQLISLPRFLYSSWNSSYHKKTNTHRTTEVCAAGSLSNLTASSRSKYFINGTSCFRGNLFCYNRNGACQPLIKQSFRAPLFFSNGTIIVFILHGLGGKCDFQPWHVLLLLGNALKLPQCNSNSYAVYNRDCLSKIYKTMETWYAQCVFGELISLIRVTQLYKLSKWKWNATCVVRAMPLKSNAPCCTNVCLSKRSKMQVRKLL